MIKTAWQSFVGARKGDFGLVFRSLDTVFLTLVFGRGSLDFTRMVQAGAVCGCVLCFGGPCNMQSCLGWPLFLSRHFFRLLQVVF